MKPLLALTVCCFAFFVGHAQIPAPKMIAIPPGTSVEYKDGKYHFRFLNDSGFVLNGPSLPQNKKPGVYRLRQDNMPCIVPDTKDLAVMPNAFRGAIKVPFIPVQPRIPNAATPKAFPDTKR